MRKIVIIICIFLFHVPVQAGTQQGRLLTFEAIGTFSIAQAKMALKKKPPLNTLTIHHEVQLYKIIYYTQAPDGSLTLASGLVAMPLHPKKPVSIVSFQHGTRYQRGDVPSRNNERNHIYVATFASSAGFMTVMPDYLGLGDNELALHPYVQADTLASSSIHMLMASKDLAYQLNYPINDALYLAGYSEGGFSTMVMFESMILNYPSIPITAVAAGAAPFDFEETMRYIMLQPGPRATGYLAYFFYSLQTYQQYWTNLEEIFVPPYDTLIPKLFDGYHTGPEIVKALPKNPLSIFKAPFAQNILKGKDRNMEALKFNFNHYDFIPSAPLLLIGSKGDKDVPYDAQERAYFLFRQYSDSVYIQSVSDTLDHIEAQPFVLKEQLLFFKQYEPHHTNK